MSTSSAERAARMSELDHKLWELSACGRHGTRERGEASCYSCLVVHDRVVRAYEMGKLARSSAQPKGEGK